MISPDMIKIYGQGLTFSHFAIPDRNIEFSKAFLVLNSEKLVVNDRQIGG